MSQPRVAVILGSSRNESNTLKAVKKLSPYPNFELIDLRSLGIGYYSYSREGLPLDDFSKIAKSLPDYDVIIFATPVYWYCMSGQMKVFFDRLTELTAEHKSIGKALHGKKTYLIACGAAPHMPEGFEIPFKRTSEYFGMEFIESFYHCGRLTEAPVT
jgi:multimeric flavodoxin WrbA